MSMQELQNLQPDEWKRLDIPLVSKAPGVIIDMMMCVAVVIDKWL